MFTPLEESKILMAKEKLVADLKLRFDKMNHPFTTAGMYLSGGAIASLLQGEKPNDYDIYFVYEKQANDVKEWLINAGINLVEEVDEKYRGNLETNADGKLITEHAITLRNGIQFIIGHSGSPNEVRQTFDYVHCKPYLDFSNGKLYISKQQYEACVNKKLIVNNPSTVTEKRKYKFLDRGYKL